MSAQNKTASNRRRFLKESGRSLGIVMCLALGLGVNSRQGRALPARALRPPGALPEDDFNAACIRCGLCVRDCPFDILHLATPEQHIPTGTPYFIAREKGCEMCEDIPCIPACPTNALNHDLTNIDDARMGLAVLVDQEACIAFQGLRCEVCFNICPVRGEAITLEYIHNQRSDKHAMFIPIVHSDSCTGCGKCEQACILDETAIRVLPMALAKGLLGKHYRLGWEQKQQAGGSMVTPDTEHKYNLPEGMRYDYDGVGLIDERPAAAPEEATSVPGLDVLNQKGKP